MNPVMELVERSIRDKFHSVNSILNGVAEVL